MLLEGAEAFAKGQRAYVATFSSVWIATKFLAESRAPSPAEAATAAQRIHYALGVWGAGRRRAPKVASVEELVRMLSDERVWRPAAKLWALVATWDVADIEPVDLVEAIPLLGRLATAGFDSSSVRLLYPLKLLLMLTGLGPVPDRWVRAGLKAAGCPGWTSSVEVVPEAAGAPVATRLMALWADAALRTREELPTREAGDPDIRWLVEQKAFGRVADMAYFSAGRQPVAAPDAEG